MSFASPCFKKREDLTEEDILRLKELPFEMKIVHTLMRIQEFYIIHNGKVRISITDELSSEVLNHLAKSKYPSIISEQDSVSGMFHDDIRFDPMVIWNEEDLNKYIKKYCK